MAEIKQKMIKTILFFITAPVVWPVMALFSWSWGKHDHKDYGWYQKAWTRESSIFHKAIAILLTPLVLFAGLFSFLVYPVWEALLD